MKLLSIIKTKWLEWRNTERQVFSKKAAIALTFDDASQDHFDIAFPILQKFNFKATFFVLPGLTRAKRSDPFLPGSSAEKWAGVSWQELKQMSDAGHEIANHSMAHKKLTALNDSDLQTDVERSFAMIQKEIGKAPESFAFPWNIFDERVKSAALSKHRFTRDEQHLAFGDPASSMKSFLEIIDQRIKTGGKIVAMIHGIDDRKINPDRTYTVTTEFFTEFLSELKKREKELSIDTFANVRKYSSI